jgi:hypothetical protein
LPARAGRLFQQPGRPVAERHVAPFDAAGGVEAGGVEEHSRLRWSTSIERLQFLLGQELRSSDALPKSGRQPIGAAVAGRVSPSAPY